MPAVATKLTQKKTPPVKKHLGIKILAEDISFQPGQLNIQYRDGIGVINDVKLLGWKSRNKNRSYDPKGVKESLYEGKEVYVDHPDPENQKAPRKVRDKFGWVEGVYKTVDGLFAKEFKFNPKHAIAEDFKFWATKNPNKIGFSQNAFGDVYEGNGGELVEEVTEVRSIDLVADPATTKGLYETYADTEKGEGHTGYEGEEEKTNEDLSKDKSKKAESSPGPSSVTPVEKLMTEDEEEEEETEGKDIKDEKPKHLEEDLPEEEEETGEETPDEDAGPLDDGGPMAGEEEPPPEEEMADEEVADITPELSSAAQKIFDSPSMDAKTKLQHIAKLLSIHPAHMEEAVQVKDLPSAKRVARKLASKHKLKSVPMILEALGNYEIMDKLRAKKKRMNELIKAAKLPEGAVDDEFKFELMEAKDEQRMQIKIDSRRRIFEQFVPRSELNRLSSRPKSAAGSPVQLAGKVKQPRELEEQFKPEKKKTKEEQDKALEAFESEVFAGTGWE